MIGTCTREQYHALGELGFFNGRRVELLSGEIIEMSPKGWLHVVGCRKTAEFLERVFAGIAWVARQEPLVLGDSEPDPDVAVLPGRFEDYTDHPTSALLIVEVADTSLDLDTAHISLSLQQKSSFLTVPRESIRVADLLL